MLSIRVFRLFSTTTLRNVETMSLKCLPSASGYDILRDPPNSRHIVWKGKPKTVLCVKNRNNEKSAEKLELVANHLSTNYGMTVLVEPGTVPKLTTDGASNVYSFDVEETEHLGRVLDFVVAIGGGGTLLHAASLCGQTMPPVVGFDMGTVGFLLPFNASNHSILSTLDKVIGCDDGLGHSINDCDDGSVQVESGLSVSERMRLRARVYEGGDTSAPCSSEFYLVNELTVHRWV